MIGGLWCAGMMIMVAPGATGGWLAPLAPEAWREAIERRPKRRAHPPTHPTGAPLGAPLNVTYHAEAPRTQALRSPETREQPLQGEKAPWHPQTMNFSRPNQRLDGCASRSRCSTSARVTRISNTRGLASTSSSMRWLRVPHHRLRGARLIRPVISRWAKSKSVASARFCRLAVQRVASAGKRSISP
jgi:hypothetical protein